MQINNIDCHGIERLKGLSLSGWLLVAAIRPHQLQQKETEELQRLNIKKPRHDAGLLFI